MRKAHGLKVRREVFSYLPPRLEQLLQYLDDQHCEELEEIRLRTGQPLLLRSNNGEYTLDSRGRRQDDLSQGYHTSLDDLQGALASISDNSLYAYEEDVNRGFITIPGGHRVGLAGQVLVQQGVVKRVKDFSSLCIRIAREVKGCAQPLIDQVRPGNGPVKNTLIISPPRCGKTTVLRDLARILSLGDKERKGCNVVLIDERSELSGCYRGVPQLDVGPRADVLDGCPKHLGVFMALRSLSPQVIITDELGGRADVEAVRECLNAGVSIISTVHAAGVDELLKRPLMREILDLQAFSLAIVLSRRRGPGSLEALVRMDAYDR